ncbi:MAG: TonB-dependent receptor [Saprospiraceae bacterium]|nr:TonB-dependent receptor [Saprospiraceae bacterium]
MKYTLSLLLFCCLNSDIISQDFNDSIKNINLKVIEIGGNRNSPDINRLDAIQNNFIYSGKKNEIIELTNKDVALSEKYGRQIFSKVPGVFVYDMDGTGNQMNISTRGLDPHRGWEFNIRKDGVITNSDMYGYPASHYNIPMEAVERIELVRGTGSLQYGAQFGGLINYVDKKPTDKKLGFETINTIGSYGLLSTYNALSGTLGKFRYNAWLAKKSNTGYRHFGDSKYNAENISLYYDISDAVHLKFEWTHSNYLIHLAGALTDAEFEKDPRAATRTRNYYNPDIHVPSIKLNWKIGQNTKLSLTTSAVHGYRNSVLFDKPTNIKDTIVAATLQYNNRQVDIDEFNSFTSELKILQSYKLLKQTSTLVAGMQYMNNDLNRMQLGKGTTGTDFDLSLVSPGFGRDLHFKTKNIAVFAENRLVAFENFSLNVGMRVEIGESNLSGKINYYPDDKLPNTIKHSFPLFGVNAEYAFNSKNNIYGGWSQAYRPVILKDIIPGSIFEKSNSNLQDAEGSNLELGFRGSWKFFKWDVTGFMVDYNNRLGTIAQKDSAGNLIIYRTNIGNSQTKGVECFMQVDISLGKKSSLNFFTSTSYMDAKYKDAVIRSGNDNISVDGNKVESVPEWISRNGFTFKYSKLSLTALSSFTSESFADALNTVQPTLNGASGLVPSYHILDLNLTMVFTENLKVQLNGNNILDAHYFTKRPQFYPGPGIWPSDGRTFSLTVGYSLNVQANKVAGNPKSNY